MWLSIVLYTACRSKGGIHLKTLDIQCVERKLVAMDARIIPRRTGTIIIEILASHFRQLSKPPSEVIDSLTGRTGRLRSGLAANMHTSGTRVRQLQ